MNLVHKATTAFRRRKRYTYADLSDWKLFMIGIPSFAVGAYYLWVSGNVTVEILTWSRDHAITLETILAVGFLGMLWLSGLYFATVARRCYELIYERNFR